MIMQYKTTDVRMWASKYFDCEHWQKAYEENIKPLPDVVDWQTDLDNINASQVLPPLRKLKRGRPKKKRIESMLENCLPQGSRRQRCGFCGEYGTHNKRGCPQRVANSITHAAELATSTSPSRSVASSVSIKAASGWQSHLAESQEPELINAYDEINPICQTANDHVMAESQLVARPSLIDRSARQLQLRSSM